MCFLPSASSSSIDVFGLARRAGRSGRGRRWCDGVLEEVSLDLIGSDREYYNQLALGMHGHAGEVRADLAPLAGVRVALGALLLKTSFPRDASPPFRTTGASAWMTFFAIGIGQPAPLGEQSLARWRLSCPDGLPGPASGRAIKWTSAPYPLRFRLTSAIRPLRLAEQRRALPCWPPGSSAPMASTMADPTPGARRSRHRGDQAARKFGRRLRRRPARMSRHGPRVGLGRSISCRAASMRADIGLG